jgi:hypothetical protein
VNLYIYHGRLSPNGGATDVEGNEVDDWGFEGPTLKGCVGFHSAYFNEGHFTVYFESEEARRVAEAITGWKPWDETGLTVVVNDGCLHLFNAKRQRYEYFGDWGLK